MGFEHNAGPNRAQRREQRKHQIRNIDKRELLKSIKKDILIINDNMYYGPKTIDFRPSLKKHMELAKNTNKFFMLSKKGVFDMRNKIRRTAHYLTKLQYQVAEND